MKPRITEDELNQKIAKLPTWAQKHIELLTRQRDDARADEKKYLDEQTESPFFVQYCGPKNDTKRYVQAHTMTVRWGGVVLRVDAHDFNKMNGPGIQLRWESEKHNDVALVPMHHQACRLVAKEDL